MVSRIFLVCCSCALLAACGADETSQPHATNETNASQQQTQAAAQAEREEEAPMSEFLADSLHPIEPARPGRFRLEVAGEVHEGDLSGCGWSMRTEEGANQDRFSAGAGWRADGERRLTLEMWRVVMHDDFFWNANHGHEIDRVALRMRISGGEPTTSWMLAVRTRPGADPTWRWGSGETPAVRVAPDGMQATVVGELDGPDTDGGTPLTGPFELAVHCAES
jgi:hypothetical protein